eukprot:1169248-Pleurochrysis_carterae.AAC.1
MRQSMNAVAKAKIFIPCLRRTVTPPRDAYLMHVLTVSGLGRQSRGTHLIGEHDAEAWGTLVCLAGGGLL